MMRRDLVTLFLVEDMRRMKRKKEPGNATRVSVKKEMAKPRMARSARITELNLDTARIPEQPTITMPGTVDKIIPSLRPGQPEKVQIAVDVAAPRHRDHLLIENTLTDEHGNDVKLQKGARVEVTVTAEARRYGRKAMQRSRETKYGRD